MITLSNQNNPGDKFTPQELREMFHPQSGGRTVFKYPTNCQLRIKGCVSCQCLANPNCFNNDGLPCLIVMKDGNGTKLMVGCYASLEAHLSDSLGVIVDCSINGLNLAIYNYDKKSGPFSTKGDSGSLIFDGNSQMVGIFHFCGVERCAPSRHLCTPAW
jgi:hypothetical protein